QDRGRWDRDLIDEAVRLLERARALASPGPYQLEAAINALQAEAADEASTDWAQIVILYRELRRHRPTPVTLLNLAVATSFAAGPAAGLAILDAPELADHLADYRYFHAARADLLRREGRSEEAAAAYRLALALTGNEAERRFLARRLGDVGDSSAAD
ncbi:MAG: RNA polymerase subunit sigma-24, partial [Actinomycetota bacterium]